MGECVVFDATPSVFATPESGDPFDPKTKTEGLSLGNDRYTLGASFSPMVVEKRPVMHSIGSIPIAIVRFGKTRGVESWTSLQSRDPVYHSNSCSSTLQLYV
jgi:hypothetical protein